MATQSSSYYRTTHTPLVAYLESEGFRHISLEHDDLGRAVFVFFNNDESLDEAIRNFELGTAYGNVRTCFNSYKRLLKVVRDARES